MNTATATAVLAELVARAKGYTYTPSASGEPIRSARRVIAGRLAEVKVVGWDEKIVVELDKSTEPLTVAQAADRLAGMDR